MPQPYEPQKREGGRSHPSLEFQGKYLRFPSNTGIIKAKNKNAAAGGCANTRQPEQVNAHLHNGFPTAPHGTLYDRTALFARGGFYCIRFLRLCCIRSPLLTLCSLSLHGVFVFRPPAGGARPRVWRGENILGGSTMAAEPNMTKAELMKYLALYQRAARDHSAAVARVAQCQRRLELARQGLPTVPKRPGRPPKKTKKCRPPSLSKLEEQLSTAQRQAESAWRLYKQLDDMAIIPGLSPRQCGPLLQILSAEQGDASSPSERLPPTL